MPKLMLSIPLNLSLQTNPFDLFETFFGGSMGNFSSMDEGAFRGRKRTTSVRGDDIR